MNTTTIEIQLGSKQLDQAQKLAKLWGFNSAGEVLSEVFKQLLKKGIGASLTHETKNITLTEKAKLRYEKMTNDSREGKNTYVANSVDEFLAQLNA